MAGGIGGQEFTLPVKITPRKGRDHQGLGGQSCSYANSALGVVQI